MSYPTLIPEENKNEEAKKIFKLSQSLFSCCGVNTRVYRGYYSRSICRSPFWTFSFLTLNWAKTRAYSSFLAIVLITALAVFLYHRNRGRYRSLHVDVDETRLAPPRAGIIWLFGPGNFDHLLFALEHHHKGGGALRCWLIMQNIQKVKKN